MGHDYTTSTYIVITCLQIFPYIFQLQTTKEKKNWKQSLDFIQWTNTFEKQIKY